MLLVLDLIYIIIRIIRISKTVISIFFTYIFFYACIFKILFSVIVLCYFLFYTFHLAPNPLLYTLPNILHREVLLISSLSSFTPGKWIAAI